MLALSTYSCQNESNKSCIYICICICICICFSSYNCVSAKRPRPLGTWTSSWIPQEVPAVTLQNSHLFFSSFQTPKTKISFKKFTKFASLISFQDYSVKISNILCKILWDERLNFSYCHLRSQYNWSQHHQEPESHWRRGVSIAQKYISQRTIVILSI